MRSLAFLIVGMMLFGCGDENSVSSVLEDDYGIRTLKNGSSFEGTLGEDQFTTFLLELSSTETVKISVSASDDVAFWIVKKTNNGWENVESIDDNYDTPDQETFEGRLMAGTYTVSLAPYENDITITYQISVSW